MSGGRMSRYLLGGHRMPTIVNIESSPASSAQLCFWFFVFLLKNENLEAEQQSPDLPIIKCAKYLDAC